MSSREEVHKEILAKMRLRNIPTGEERFEYVSDYVEAAIAYAYSAIGMSNSAQRAWPWTLAISDFEPENPLRDLVRAGELIAAAIERLQEKQE